MQSSCKSRLDRLWSGLIDTTTDVSITAWANELQQAEIAHHTVVDQSAIPQRND